MIIATDWAAFFTSKENNFEIPKGLYGKVQKGIYFFNFVADKVDCSSNNTNTNTYKNLKMEWEKKI